MNPKLMRLRPNEAAVFGYGSLISRASLERTLQRPYDGPFIACAVKGWHRSWDVAMPNHGFYAKIGSERVTPQMILYLNVQPLASSSVNGVLVVVTHAELQALDRREWIYDRRVVTHELRGVQLTGGDAFMYVAKTQYVTDAVTSPAVAAVRATYLDILEAGLRSMGTNFRKEFERSSDPVPQQLVIQDLRD